MPACDAAPVSNCLIFAEDFPYAFDLVELADLVQSSPYGGEERYDIAAQVLGLYERTRSFPTQFVVLLHGSTHQPLLRRTPTVVFTGSEMKLLSKALGQTRFNAFYMGTNVEPFIHVEAPFGAAVLRNIRNKYTALFGSDFLNNPGLRFGENSRVLLFSPRHLAQEAQMSQSLDTGDLMWKNQLERIVAELTVAFDFEATPLGQVPTDVVERLKAAGVGAPPSGTLAIMIGDPKTSLVTTRMEDQPLFHTHDLIEVNTSDGNQFWVKAAASVPVVFDRNSQELWVALASPLPRASASEQRWVVRGDVPTALRRSQKQIKIFIPYHGMVTHTIADEALTVNVGPGYAVAKIPKQLEDVFNFSF